MNNYYSMKPLLHFMFPWNIYAYQRQIVRNLRWTFCYNTNDILMVKDIFVHSHNFFEMSGTFAYFSKKSWRKQLENIISIKLLK